MKKRTKVVGTSPKPFEMNRIRLMRYHNDLCFGSQDGASNVWMAVLLALLFAPMSFTWRPNQSPTKVGEGS